MKPNFIGIGVQKAATSWLHEVLGHHPDVFVSDPKELDFFSYFFDRGYEWYERHFAQGGGRRVLGETSPSYLYNPAVPARIHDYDPDMRIIVILRDPIARAFSNHLHEIRKGHLTLSENFEDGLRNNPAYLEQGFYHRHLSNWLSVFGRDKVLILISEEIERNADAELARVLTHLGLNTSVNDEWARGRSHESVGYKNPVLGRTVRNAGRMIRRAGLGDMLDTVKRLPPIEAALSLNRRDLRRELPRMREDTRARLVGTFADDVLALPQLIGRDSLPWPTWEAAAVLRGLRPSAAREAHG